MRARLLLFVSLALVTVGTVLALWLRPPWSPRTGRDSSQQRPQKLTELTVLTSMSTEPPQEPSPEGPSRAEKKVFLQVSAAGPCHPVFPPEAEQFRTARERMVRLQLATRDIVDPDVLRAMGRIPRHEFVPPDVIDEAYDDHPLPIGHGQTISQPYIVALMTQLARPRPESRALDIGTGSGYQAAILAELCREVYSIEIITPLAEEAAARLKRLGYTNISVRAGDGYRGWPDKAPFDVIIVAAAPDHVPQPLVDQLAVGGRLVIPVGRGQQELVVIEKRRDGSLRREVVAPVLFVPMTGEAQRPARD